MGLAVFAIVIVLLFIGGGFLWRPENRTWANVAMAIFGLGLILFAAMGTCSVVSFTDLRRNDDPYGFMPAVVIVGIASIAGLIACWIGVQRNRK